jgi:hypothetical protein
MLKLPTCQGRFNVKRKDNSLLKNGVPKYSQVCMINKSPREIGGL